MTEKNKDSTIALKVERVIPETLRTQFVSDIAIQHQPDFFVLSLFELLPPLIIGESVEEIQEVTNSIDSVKSICVARLVLTPDKFRELVEIASDNLNRYEDRFNSEKG